jgi:hypothetical protein
LSSLTGNETLIVDESRFRQLRLAGQRHGSLPKVNGRKPYFMGAWQSGAHCLSAG